MGPEGQGRLTIAGAAGEQCAAKGAITLRQRTVLTTPSTVASFAPCPPILQNRDNCALPPV